MKHFRIRCRCHFLKWVQLQWQNGKTESVSNDDFIKKNTYLNLSLTKLDFTVFEPTNERSRCLNLLRG